MSTPRNLAELKALKDPTARAQAAIAYVEERQAAIREALAIRDQAVRSLVSEHGVTKTARMVGMSASYVKQVRRAVYE